VKILDRYVLTLFLKNYVISLTVLIGLYVIMDMVFNFDHLVSVQKSATATGLTSALSVMRDVVSYYFYQSFLIFVQLSGIIPVVAAAFTLLRLSRFGELTAFLAAGVPLLRVTVAIIFAAILLNALLIADQELLLPRMIPKLTRKHEEVHTAAVPYFPVRSMQVDQRALLVAARFWPASNDRPARLEEMDIIERDDQLRPVSHLFAKTADWDGQAWRLTEGRRVVGLLPTQHPSDEEAVDVYHGDVTPEEIALYHSSEFVELLSTRRINELIARPKSYGAVGLYRVKHMRFTQPIMNVVLLLLAIPTVLTHDPKSLKSAASKCLTLTGLAMGSVFLGQQIAGHPPGGALWANAWTALLAWVPIFIFAPISVWLLDRVKT
jgi:lipopolysaccharide export LptBFGC system permease protein LptF